MHRRAIYSDADAAAEAALEAHNWAVAEKRRTVGETRGFEVAGEVCIPGTALADAHIALSEIEEAIVVLQGGSKMPRHQRIAMETIEAVRRMRRSLTPPVGG